MFFHLIVSYPFNWVWELNLEISDVINYFHFENFNLLVFIVTKFEFGELWVIRTILFQKGEAVGIS